jgi:hypothetical protein
MQAGGTQIEDSDKAPLFNSQGSMFSALNYI